MPIDLLVDTGSSQTALLASDLLRLGVDVDGVRARWRGTLGMGSGPAPHKTVNARLTFDDDEAPGGYRAMETHIDLMPHTPISLPSVLGRDILNQCACVFNHSTGAVELKVLAH